jgi:hypothetical protein
MSNKIVGASLTGEQDAHALSGASPEGAKVKNALPVARTVTEGEGCDNCKSDGRLNGHAPKVYGVVCVEENRVSNSGKAGVLGAAAQKQRLRCLLLWG